MSIPFQGSDRTTKFPDQALRSSTFGPETEMSTKEATWSTVTDYPSGDGEEQRPINLSWESKPTFLKEDPSSSTAAAREQEEEKEEEEDDEIDAQLKVVLESLRDLYRESEGLCKNVFSKFQREHLSKKKQNTEDQADSKRKAFIKLGNKKISRILKQEVKWNEEKAGVLQRSVSFDSPRTPPERFKVKTFEIRGGGGGGGADDVKGLSTTTKPH